MKKNKLSSGSNLLWEASRMMLPEHKEAIITQLDHQAIKAKPQLDEQKLDEIANLIQESFYAQTSIEITTFDIQHEARYIGKVTYIDPRLKYIKLDDNEQIIRISCQSITDVVSSSRYE